MNLEFNVIELLTQENKSLLKTRVNELFFQKLKEEKFISAVVDDALGDFIYDTVERLKTDKVAKKLSTFMVNVIMEKLSDRGE